MKKFGMISLVAYVGSMPVSATAQETLPNGLGNTRVCGLAVQVGPVSKTIQSETGERVGITMAGVSFSIELLALRTSVIALIEPGKKYCVVGHRMAAPRPTVDYLISHTSVNREVDRREEY